MTTARGRALYLEERIGIIRKRLNENTVGLCDAIADEALREKWTSLIRGCLDVCDGSAWTLDRRERERFFRRKP